jgi:GntR family transcriptional regulator
VEIAVDTGSFVPPSQQILEAFLDAIATGALATGARLPSVRQLAAMVLVNANTVARSYAELERMGIVRGENGRGVFVTAEGPRLAREQRQSETLQGFERAASIALRAGHVPARLSRALDRRVREVS